MRSDRRARFEEVVAAVSPDLHRYLLRRLVDPQESQDALSEVFLAAWRREGDLPDDEVEARMWLFGIAHNVMRNALRARTRRSAATARIVEAHRTGARSDLVAANDDGDHDRVRDLIAALPEGQRELVRLHHWEGLQLQEAAVVLGISASAARSRYATARRTLREQLETSTGSTAVSSG